MRLHVHTAHGHWSKRAGAGQLHRLAEDRGLPWLALVLALLLAAPGCTGLYSRARSQFPSDPAAETDLRMAAARQADEAVQQTAATLCDDLRQERSAGTVRTGFDRLELAAFELERQTLTAADAAKRSGHPEKSAAEITRLGGQAHAWLEFVRVHRTTPASEQLRSLEERIRSESPSGSPQGSSAR